MWFGLCSVFLFCFHQRTHGRGNVFSGISSGRLLTPVSRYAISLDLVDGFQCNLAHIFTMSVGTAKRLSKSEVRSHRSKVKNRPTETYFYLLCKSYQGTRKIMQTKHKKDKNNKKNIQKRTPHTVSVIKFEAIV